jgi:Protein of unknown function (DUF3175)
MATSSRKKASSKTARKSQRKTASKTITRRKQPAKRKASPKRWSQRVTRESDALDLKRGVFTLRDPKRIAASLKRSAERSSRRKAGAYRSALSMLTFYVNRAGKTLPKTQRERLERAACPGRSAARSPCGAVRCRAGAPVICGSKKPGSRFCEAA